MMPRFWVVLWSTLPPLVLVSAPDGCDIQDHHSSHNASSLLRSLNCHNDYESYVQCSWREGPHSPLQLWFHTQRGREPCEPYTATGQDARSTTVQCRYKTSSFSIGIKHTVFFLGNETLCPSPPRRPLSLSQHLRARPPLHLSTRDEGDRGRWFTWSSPYPTSSSLSRNLMYQLGYRRDGQDTWTDEDVWSTELNIPRHLMLPGHNYEARVRGRASMGHWSDWSPVVTWRTQEAAADAPRFPSLSCVLDGETDVTCSWEVNRELDHFITYQLACRHNQSALWERCCDRPTVRSGSGRKVLMFSCSLTVTHTAHLLLELQPTRTAKTFKANKHIRPHPPQQVRVREKNRNWMVEWTEPSTASKLRLHYQVCYYRTRDEESSVLLNISEGSMSLTILDESLSPSQQHQVKIRSVVVPGEGTRYEGTPSEWSDPVEWTSHAASWSLPTMMYVSISVFVVTVFLTVYCTIPACQRRVLLWMDSVPSPGKSKIFFEIKSAASPTLTQTETTSTLKGHNLDRISSCPSDTWLSPSTGKRGLEQAKSCRNYNNMSSSGEKVNGFDLPLDFTGPYIFCQSSTPKCTSVNDNLREEQNKRDETSSDGAASPSSVDFCLHREHYVCLPTHSVSRSSENLVSHRDANANMCWHEDPERDHQGPDNTLEQPAINEPTSNPDPPGYISGPPTSWPTVKTSGYCLLPTAPTPAK